MKPKTAYVCTECGYDSTKWLGRCPSCGAWDSFKEVKLGKTTLTPHSSLLTPHSAAGVCHLLSDIETSAEVRLDTHDDEFNRVLGGGLVKGSLVLLGGEPGIGKSTLLLQTVLRMTDLKILYVSGEESEQQLKMRAERLSSQSSIFNLSAPKLGEVPVRGMGCVNLQFSIFQFFNFSILLKVVYRIDAYLGSHERLRVFTKEGTTVGAVVFLEMGKAYIYAGLSLDAPVGREYPRVAVEGTNTKRFALAA